MVESTGTDASSGRVFSVKSMAKMRPNEQPHFKHFYIDVAGAWCVGVSPPRLLSLCSPTCKGEFELSMKRMILPLLFAVAPLTLAHAGEEALTGASLQNTVAGRTVYINTPMGEVPIRYSKNGHVSGYTELAVLDGEVHNQGSRPLVGCRQQALHSLAELDVRSDPLLHHAPRRPERRPLAPGGWEERVCPAWLSPTDIRRCRPGKAKPYPGS